MSAPATIVCLLTLHLFGACVYAVQLDAAISAECRQHCASLSMVVDFEKCMAECVQIYEEIGSDDNRMPPSGFPEFSSESQQQHRPSALWPPHRQPEARDDVFFDRKRLSLSLSPRAASLVGSGSAHQYLRIGRSFGGSQAGKSSLLDEEANMAAAAGSRYPIERRNVNSLTGSRLASAAKSYLRVGKKDAETPEAPSS